MLSFCLLSTLPSQSVKLNLVQIKDNLSHNVVLREDQNRIVLEIANVDLHLHI
jgi:hypothetical protein